jgi:hypothetical protein
MARSKKTAFRKKVRKSRKQRGGGIQYDNFLKEAKAEINAVGQGFWPSTLKGGIMTKWAKEPIEIPGMGMYIGSYCLWNGSPLMRGTGMLTSFETNEKTGLPEFIKEGDWFNNKEHGQFKILYGDGDVVSLVHMKHGLPLPSWTEEERKGEGDLASQYVYSNGQVYNGDLIFKNGKIVPANDLKPPRTVFNFAPGPEQVYNGEGKTIKIPAREAERGFRMSQDPDFMPPVPPNSPQREPTVVRRGTGLRGRLSGIRDSRMTSAESGPMDSAEELRQMRELAASQTGFKPLSSLERKSVLPAITRRGGKYRKHKKSNKKTRKTRRH